MLKDLFHIPDTLESEDRRYRRILNILLVAFIGLALSVIVLMTMLHIISTIRVLIRVPFELYDTTTPALIAGMIVLVNALLLAANRSTKVPVWLSASIFVTMLTVVITQLDRPDDRYAGTSLIAWVVPIMVSAVLLRPTYVFLITAIISVLIQVFPSPVETKYYATIALFAIALLCWLAMSIANQAIRDARRQAANIETILNSIADGVLVLDLEGRFISANQALLKMIPEDNLREINTKPLEETMQWKRTVFSVRVSPVPGEGSVIIFRDETRRHETERAKDALLATASHELRTPLGAVMNYLELLQMLTEIGKVNTKKFSEHLGRALENSKRLQRLVNDILDQAQIQAGVLEFNEQPFDLRALLEKTHRLLEVLLKEKELSYTLTIAPDVPMEINGDPERLHQVLVNLIGNAIKFTHQGGIQVSIFLRDKENLSIEVIDTGPGIPDEQLPDIFEAFRRGSNYAQREQQGAGLGLSIAKEIVTHMGGKISVASVFGAGSTFTVSLPIKRA